MDKKRSRSNKRMTAILRFLDHPAVERQPAEFAVDETGRAGRIEGGIVALVFQHDDIIRCKRIIGRCAGRRIVGGLGLGGHGGNLAEFDKAVVTKTVNSP